MEWSMEYKWEGKLWELPFFLKAGKTDQLKHFWRVRRKHLALTAIRKLLHIYTWPWRCSPPFIAAVWVPALFTLIQSKKNWRIGKAMTTYSYRKQILWERPLTSSLKVVNKQYYFQRGRNYYRSVRILEKLMRLNGTQTLSLNIAFFHPVLLRYWI